MTEDDRAAAGRDELAAQLDREDLLAVLEMRFGAVPPDILRRIGGLRESDLLQRLILVAANVPDWKTFLDELGAQGESFRLVGEDFNPLAQKDGGAAR